LKGKLRTYFEEISLDLEEEKVTGMQLVGENNRRKVFGHR
jgi:hypothetical protein